MQHGTFRVRSFSLALWVGLAFGLSPACAPRSFELTPDSRWSTVLIRPSIVYDRAWDQTVDLLVRHFDIEVMSKEDGYVRTDWMYRWTGELTDDYRVRVTVKFSPDRSRAEVKTEAEYGGPGDWMLGSDRRLQSEMEDALRDRIGRAGSAPPSRDGSPKSG